MNKTSRVYVAGHTGMVGSALVRAFRRKGLHVLRRTREQLDLTHPSSVREFYDSERPTHVIIAAAKVGGIMANSTYPVEFLSENLQIELNLINAAYEYGVEKLLFLGSSCIYPKFAPQPLTESSLLTGPLERTNECYALAKICGIKLCQAYATEYGKNFISAQPTNLYGINDNFYSMRSHVIPAIMRKFHEAMTSSQESVTLWGSGSPYREFLHADDLADACVFLMESYDSPELINVGCGIDLTIADAASLIAKVVGFKGVINWDTTKPDGTPKKLLDVSKITDLGWKPKIRLEDGLRQVYEWWVHSS